MASPRAFMTAVLKSNTSVATGEPETNFRVAVASLLIAHRRCRTTSKVIGSSWRVPVATAMFRPPLYRHDQVQVLVHAHRLARVYGDGGRAALDDGRAGDDVARAQRLARVDGGR